MTPIGNDEEEFEVMEDLRTLARAEKIKRDRNRLGKVKALAEKIAEVRGDDESHDNAMGGL